MTPDIKKLSPTALCNITLVNKAREENNLKPIEIKIRSCLACGAKFESTGMRTCGCNRAVSTAQYDG